MTAVEAQCPNGEESCENKQTNSQTIQNKRTVLIVKSQSGILTLM